MPRLISDAHERISEIPTVPIYRLAKTQPRERAWDNQRGSAHKTHVLRDIVRCEDMALAKHTSVLREAMLYTICCTTAELCK